MTGTSALGRLLGTSVDPREFAERYWGRDALLVLAAERGQPGGHADGELAGELFSAAAADELLAHRGLRTPFLRLARDGDVLASSRFTGGGGKGATVSDQVDPAKVMRELAAGTTVVFQGLHRVWAPLAGFTRSLQRELGHPVQVNAYLTPAGAQGFATHYDTHDVFVVQVTGDKGWRVHHPVVDDPGESEPWTDHRAEVAAAAESEPVLDHVMTPGDVLYLPRGWLHSARAQNGTSLHLTIGVHPYTRADLLDVVLAALHERVQRSPSLPLGLDTGDPGHLVADLDAVRDSVLAALPEALEPSRVSAGLRALLERDVPAEPVDPVAQLALSDRLQPSTSIRLRLGTLPRADEDDGRLRLTWTGGSLTLPAEAATAVKALLAGGVLLAGRLPGLDEASSLVVAARLLREGACIQAETARD